MYLIIQYIKFLFRSRNQHGVHSPFIYQLITQCFYNKTPFESYETLESFRKRLYANDTKILVQDFGAGSRVFKGNVRNIHKIAKTAGITPKRAQLLFRVVNYLQPKNILEMGTSVGLATSALSLGHPDSKVLTIEGCKTTSEVAQEQFDHFEMRNIQLIHGEFDRVMDTKGIKNSNFQLIFVDGNHNKEATLALFNTLLANINNDTIMIFDDIYWSKGMTEAWEEIMKHPKVKVSIDIFYWGMIFFRKEQEKEHFSIRV